MLFNEPKLLKSRAYHALNDAAYRFSALQRAEIAEMKTRPDQQFVVERGFSALQRAEIAEMRDFDYDTDGADVVSVLFNEPKLLKYSVPDWGAINLLGVSVLFNEPKLLKCRVFRGLVTDRIRFSALQRAEIAEIVWVRRCHNTSVVSFSALQRAEIAEIQRPRAEGETSTQFQCSSTSRNC